MEILWGLRGDRNTGFRNYTSIEQPAFHYFLAPGARRDRGVSDRTSTVYDRTATVYDRTATFYDRIATT